MPCPSHDKTDVKLFKCDTHSNANTTNTDMEAEVRVTTKGFLYFHTEELNSQISTEFKISKNSGNERQVKNFAVGRAKNTPSPPPPTHTHSINKDKIFGQTDPNINALMHRHGSFLLSRMIKIGQKFATIQISFFTFQLEADQSILLLLFFFFFIFFFLDTCYIPLTY